MNIDQGYRDKFLEDGERYCESQIQSMVYTDIQLQLSWLLQGSIEKESSTMAEPRMDTGT